MAGERIRSLKPEWLDDEKLASTSDTARMMSAALILLADDHGRGRGNHLFLASRIYPYSKRDPRETLRSVSGGLRELCDCGFLHVYQVAGQDYYEIRNWKRHQRVDKPGRPRVPEPGGIVSRESPEELALDLGSGISDRGSGTVDLGASARRAAPKSWRRFPPEWIPDAAIAALADELGVDMQRELAAIRDHEFARSRKDPDATFRTWLRKAAEYGRTVRGAGKAAAPRIASHAEHAAQAAGERPPKWMGGPQ